MRSRGLGFVVRFSLFLRFAVLGVQAQRANAHCLPGWEWNRNSLGQDPCTVGSILDGFCRNRVDYAYGEIQKGEHYIPPDGKYPGDLECDCNTVIYSLVMACATCQEGVAYGWSAWIVNCNEAVIAENKVDVPEGAKVPRWAYYNVTLLEGGVFDNENAKKIGRNPEVTGSSSYTSAGNPEVTKPLDTSTTSGGPRDTSIPDNKSTPGGSKTAAIAGGVVGGICALAIASIVACFVIRRRRRDKEKITPQYDEGPVSPWGTSPTSPSVTLKQYDPADPLTFPPPIPWSQTPNQFPHEPSTAYVTPLSNYGASQ